MSPVSPDLTSAPGRRPPPTPPRSAWTRGRLSGLVVAKRSCAASLAQTHRSDLGRSDHAAPPRASRLRGCQMCLPAPAGGLRANQQLPGQPEIYRLTQQRARWGAV